MMGVQDLLRGKLCYSNFNLDKRIRANHPLGKIDQLIGFDFIYQEVADEHSLKSNVSVPPPLILKLVLLYQDQLQRAGGTPSQSGCLLQAKRREFLTQVPIFRQLLWQFMILSHPAGPGA